jgi:hypothetical protein
MSVAKTYVLNFVAEKFQNIVLEFFNILQAYNSGAAGAVMEQSGS